MATKKHKATRAFCLLWLLCFFVAMSFCRPQKTYFRANCMIRGSCTLVILPKFTLFRLVFGLLGRTALGTLKASARNSTCCFSPTLKARDRDASMLQVPKPRMDNGVMLP